MTNSINQNLNKYNNYPQKDGNMSYRAQNPSRPQVSIPEYYNVPESYQQQSAKEMIKDSMLYSMLLKPFIEHPIAVLLTWLGMGYGLDKYSEACGGKYETSLVKKAANFGDKIQESGFVQSKPVQTILGWFGSAKRGGGKIVENRQTKADYKQPKRATRRQLFWMQCSRERLMQRVVYFSSTACPVTL